MRLAITFLLFLIINDALAQERHFGERIVQKLSSPAMHGRGYVNQGDAVAADFIANYFKKLGLKPLNGNSNSYHQYFEIPVNTFPGKMEVKLNGRKLVPGKDFLVDPSSPGIKGTFPLLKINSGNFNPSTFKNASGHFLVVEQQWLDSMKAHPTPIFDTLWQKLRTDPDLPVAGILLLTQKKLTWSASTFQIARPYIQVQYHKKPEMGNIELSIDSKYYPGYRTQNVIGVREGAIFPDSIIMVTAHYDHLGRMGKKTYFPGANDNASGVALLLNLAATLKNPQNTLIFVAFGAEELGLLGSRHFIENQSVDLSRVKFLINLDITGTGDEGITVVNGSVFEKHIEMLKAINNQSNLLSQIKTRGEACISDHCFFYLAGVPCFYIYTLGGIKAYHDIYDRYQTLPLTEFEDLSHLFRLFIEKL